MKRLATVSAIMCVLHGDIDLNKNIINENKLDNLPLFSSIQEKNKKTETQKFLGDIGKQIKKDLKIKTDPKVATSTQAQTPKQTYKQDCPNIYLQHSLSSIYRHPELNCKTISLSISASAAIYEALELIGKLGNVDLHVDQSLDGGFGRQEFKNKTPGQILKHLLPYHTPALALVKDAAGFQVVGEAKAKEIFDKSKDQLDTQVFILAHADPSEKFKEELCSFWKIITANEKCTEINIQGTKVFARGRSHHMQQLATFLEAVDVPTTQVKIDLVLASTDKQFGLDFGINWSGIYNRHNTIKKQNSPFSLAGLGGLVTDVPEPTKPISESLGDIFVDPNNLGINLSNNIFSNLLNASLGGNTITVPLVFGGPDLNLARLNLMINAAEAEYKLKVFQKPTVTTLDRETVTISLGRSIPIITNIQDSVESTVRTVSTFNYRDIGVNISITPIISPDKKSVSLDLLIEDSELSSGSTRVTPGGIQTDPPVFESLKMKNRIQLCDQQTAIIGGLSRNSEIESKRNVPIISKVPVFGKLFKSSSEAKQNTETFIFITPTIICR